MQKLYKVFDISKYVKKGKKNKWPKPTKQCPNCRHYNKIIHHGFYLRYYVNCHLRINERIYIKRYYCKFCEKTISLLPDFCVRKYILSFDDIINILYKFNMKKLTLEKYLNELNKKYKYLNLSKQQYYNYLNRLIKNIPLIKSFLRIVNKNIVFEVSNKDKRERLMVLLKCIKKEFGPLDNFLYTFFQKTNKSPLSL